MRMMALLALWGRGLGVVDHFDFADGEGGGNEDGDAVVGRDLGIHGVAAHLSVIAVLKRH